MSENPPMHGVDDEIGRPERKAEIDARWEPFSNTDLLVLHEALGDQPASNLEAIRMYDHVEAELRRRKVVR